MRKYIWLSILALLVISVLFIKKKDMTWRQSIMKALYPLIMMKGKISGNEKNIKMNTNNIIPPVSFYSLQAIKNNGDTLLFESLRGKKVLIVNTASDCGYTGQYAELEKLNQQYKDKLVILGFPANDFKEQEKRNDKEIAEFCKVNYGVTFTLLKKSSVIASPEQNPVFQWLSKPEQNGWSKYVPIWNFCKYLINEEGKLEAFYTMEVSPLDKAIIEKIN